MTVKAEKKKLIGGYVPDDIMEKFIQFKKDNNLNSSSAITKIIEW